MGTVKIPYGDELLAVDVDAEFDILQTTPPQIEGEEKVLARCLENPVGKEPLAEFLEGARDVLVIVNDATRGTPTARILDVIWPTIAKVPSYKYLVAVGTHPQTSEEELYEIFKEHYPYIKHVTFVHDSRKPEYLKHIGTTSRGTEVLINKLAVQADRIITIGCVEPHYFAGYSGGRKSILPGIAGYDTVEKNHSHALSPDSYPLALRGNPVHEDMVEAVNLLGTDKIFTIQTVLTDDKRIYAAFCGDIHAAFYESVNKADEVKACRTHGKADIVVTCTAPPKDINLYQSQHALENGKLALKKRGIIIWVSACRKGVGNDSFLKLLNETDNYHDVKEELLAGYKLGYHKAAKIMELKQWAQIWAVTGIDEEVIRDAKITPFKSIQAALDEAIGQMRKRGVEPSVLIMPDGGNCVPLMYE